MKSKKIDKKIELIMEQLYKDGTSKINRPNFDVSKMAKIYVPYGSLIVTKKSISKKDFISLKLKWIKCVNRELIKKTTKKIKKK